MVFAPYLNFIIYTQYTLYIHYCNPSAIASIYTIIPLPIKLITKQRGKFSFNMILIAFKSARNLKVKA
jgi:hypothetical protein